MTVFRLFLTSCMLCATARGGLIAHWKLDSSPVDQVADFPAVWSGTPIYTTSVAAPASTAAASLAGTWLSAGTGINFERDQAFSATAWIKGGTQNSTVVGDMVQSEELKGWELHVGSTENGGNANSVTVWLVNDYPGIAIQVNATTPVLNNQWHQVAFTYDGSSTAAGVKIYIDGAQVATNSGIDTLASSIANGSAAGLNIGTRMDGAAGNFSGAIDEVALFNHVLSGAEMTTVFQSGVAAVAPPKITATTPLPGQSVNALTAADVTFSFPVSGVDAADLLVNGLPASAVAAVNSKNYHFTFAAPPQGDVNFSWASAHGIAGLNGVAAQPTGWSSLFVPVLPAGQVMIAEFLTKNAGGQEDEDHDTPDWIELVNPGTASVNLAGWALTDDPSKPARYVLPSIILSPGGRKLVFASGKNRANAASTLHANFKLADDGGYLALSDPSGNLVHVFDGYPNQEGNVSFGLLAAGKPSDGRAAWRYLPPTPGTTQSTSPYSAAAISSMDWSPTAPVAGNAVTVTIRTSPEATLTVPPVLYYKVMYGTEVAVNFADDGLHGDGAANDRLWGAVIPAGATAGQMVRWRASLTSNAVVSRWPINTSASAFLPIYEGTVIGGNTSGQVLPVYQVFVSGYVFPTSTSQTGIDTSGGGRGAFYGNGKLYDNVLIRIKGTTSSGLFKRSHRVDFNPGRDFEWSTEHPPQRELNLNSEYNDPSYLRQNLQLWMHRDSGNAGSIHFPVRLLMNGANWQLAFHSYSADSELIETMGLNPRGALYKQVGTLSSTSGEQKSRRWDTSKTDLAALATGLQLPSLGDRSTYIHDNLNLPAVINYLAVTRLAQEGDDVWANMVVYRDTEGTGEWQAIPFDLNLSFGQLFYGFSAPYNTTIEATNDANKSHPLYGSGSCLSNTGNVGQYNRLYDAIIQVPITRQMLLRRIRTLTDRYLATSAAASQLETNFNTMGALIGPDADIDRARWGWPPNALAYGLGPNISPAQGLATLKSSFLAPRRTHFYTTHSINNTGKTLGISNNQKAGIPDAQVATPVVTFGTIVAHPAGNQDSEYIQLNNPGDAAIDVSDWTIRGATGSFKFKGGTIIPSNDSIYVSPSVLAFRNRTTSPKKNERRIVVGPYSGHLSPYGETLKLETATGALIAQTTVAADPAAPAVNLAVTEILSNSAHTNTTINGDWWEITNNGSAPIDLDGFSWDDNRNLPGQTIFPSFILNAGESAIILDEDDAAEATAFRSAWNLSASVKVLTRANFKQSSLRPLGNGDSVIVYLPTGTQAARADYPEHAGGKSRAWFRNGLAIPGGYSQVGKYAAVFSNPAVSDIASPGFAAVDPATMTVPYDIWCAANDLWSTATNPAGDADGDGRTNRAEYLFGGNPRLADNAPAQSVVPASGDFDWTITRRSNDPSLVYILESSADLIHWSVITPAQVAEVPHPTLFGCVRATYRIVRDDAVKFLRARAN